MKKIIFALLCSFTIHAQTFEFECSTEWNTNNIHPAFQEYVDEFFADAEERGIVIADIDKIGTIQFVSGLAPSGRIIAARAHEPCDSGFFIHVNTELWNQFPASSTRRRTIYHELGHALLELAHDCRYYITGDDRYRPITDENQCNKIIFDVMTVCGNGFANNSLPTCVTRTDDSFHNPVAWRLAVDYMFESEVKLRCDLVTSKTSRTKNLDCELN